MKQEDEKIQTDVQHPQSKNKVEDGFAIVKSCVKGNDKSVKRFPV